MPTTIEYKKFVEYMTPILEYNKEYNENASVLKILFPSSYVVPELGTKLLHSYIMLLQTFLSDKEEWISYFVYECGFGSKPKTVTVNKKEILIDSVEKLWRAMYGEL